MPTLIVQTVSGLPAFSLPCGASDTVKKLTAAAARQANIVQKTWDGKSMKLKDVREIENVRLSRGREFLSPADTVMGLGMKDGDRLLLHVKNTPLVGGRAPLPVHSFAREGYGFFINVVSGVINRDLFKLKIVPSDAVAKVLKQALKRAKLQGWKIGGKPPKLKYKGRALKPTDKMVEIDIAAGDELLLFGLEGDEYPGSAREASGSSPRPGSPPRPMSAASVSRMWKDTVPPPSVYGDSIVRNMGGSFNLIAYSRTGAVSPGQRPDWLPVGPTNWP